MWFLRYASERETDRQTYKHADRNTSQVEILERIVHAASLFAVTDAQTTM